MKPYYELDDLTKRRILGLIEKCEETELGNVGFEYSELSRDIIFNMSKMKSYWELRVVSKRVNATRELDEYKIVDGRFMYHYSEKD